MPFYAEDKHTRAKSWLHYYYYLLNTQLMQWETPNFTPSTSTPPPSWQNSPDLNPVDYYVGSAMDRVYSTRI